MSHSISFALLRRGVILAVCSFFVAAGFAPALFTSARAQEAAVEEEASTEEAAEEADIDTVVEEAGPMQTIGVAALSSYDNLFQDIRYVGGLVGREQGAEMIEGMIALFTQGKGIEGLDKSRPVGVVVQTDGQQFVPLACLPISDLAPTLELAKNAGIEPADLGDGVYEFQLPQQTLYAKQQGEWTFLAKDQAQLSALPEDPAPVLAELAKDYDVGVRVLAQNVPAMFRTIAIEQLKQGMQQGLDREEDETEEQHAQRAALAEQQVEIIEELISNLDQLTLGMSVDESSKRAFMDGAATFVADSKFAKMFGGPAECVTKFGAFHQPEQALTLISASEMPTEIVAEWDEQNKAQVAAWREQVAHEIDKSGDIPSDEAREALKGAVNDLLDVLEATQATGKSDLGATLAVGENGMNFIGGMFAVETEKVESALKRVEGIIKQESPELPAIEWNAAEHAGVKFHSLSFPLPPEAAQAQPLFGDEISLSVGIAAEAVYFAMGPDHLTAIKQAIDESAAQTGKTVKPAELSISLSKVLQAVASVTDEENRGTIQMVADSLTKDGAQDDHLRISVEKIPGGARYRYEAEEGVIRAAGEAMSAAAAAAQQGFPPPQQ